MKLPPEHFKHCPSCGEPIPQPENKVMRCPACDFQYYFNPTIGTAGFVENGKGEILLIKRGKHPAKGKLAPPGGFADYGESAEEALSREFREETGIHVANWDYITSAVNWYTYREITYPVIDFFYRSRLHGDSQLDLCPDETQSAHWIHADSIDPEDLAFPSMQEAFRRFRKDRA